MDVRIINYKDLCVAIESLLDSEINAMDDNIDFDKINNNAYILLMVLILLIRSCTYTYINKGVLIRSCANINRGFFRLGLPG